MVSQNPFEAIEHRFEALQNSINEIRLLFLNGPSHPKKGEIGGVTLAVEITGLSRHSIYRLVCERKIPHSKRGGRLYFNRKDLLEWIEKGTRYQHDVTINKE